MINAILKRFGYALVKLDKPPRRSLPCVSVQQSDQRLCTECGLMWDVNDPHPPECIPSVLSDLKTRMSTVNGRVVIHPKAPPQPTERPLTINNMLDALVRVRQKFGGYMVRDIIKRMGKVNAVVDVKPEHYRAVIDECNRVFEAYGGEIVPPKSVRNVFTVNPEPSGQRPPYRNPPPPPAK